MSDVSNVQLLLLLKVSKVPDWTRRAIRLSLALVFFTTLGLTLWAVPERYRAEWGDEVVQSCNWAGATCAVVAASPLIGKVAQLSYERTLGTFTGGLLGFLVYDYGVLRLSSTSGQILMVAAAAAVGFVSCWLSFKFKLDASMRLFVITFLIVTFGAHNNDSRSALGVALLRTGGIIAGVLLFMLLTVIVLPKSATIEALREMKSGLKLLTELNTLVWSSRKEAAAAMQQAAAAARTAEAAVAAAASKQQQQQQQIMDSRSSGKANGFWGSLGFGSSTKAAAAQGYQPLPGADLEAGSLLPAAAAATPVPAAAGRANANAPSGPRDTAVGSASVSSSSSSNARVSQLTQALQQAGALGNSVQGFPDPAAAAAAKSSQQQQQQQGDAKFYENFMDEYEEKCEAVLTSVYQSMFKVKEHTGVADSEVYVHHFWGHYIFAPTFFGRKFINWLLPNHWRLPKAELDYLSTSVRVIARLLWTVHLDYSQGFDEVLAALPASAGMNNLLEELGQLMSAALGVLVEAFPNKNAIVVDSLSRLNKLVDSMLVLSAAQHDTLIKELAANRQPVRTNISAATAAAAAASIAAVPAQPAAAAGDSQLVAAPSRQVAFVTLDDDHNQDHDHDLVDLSVSDSLAYEGVGRPIRTESPQIPPPADSSSPLYAAAAAAAGSSKSPPRAAAAAADDGQGDLIFPLSDVTAASGITAAADAETSDPAAAAGFRPQDSSPTKHNPSFSFHPHQGFSPSQQTLNPSSPSGGLDPSSSSPVRLRHLASMTSYRSGFSHPGLVITSQGSVISRPRFKPFAVMAAVKLSTAAQHGSAASVTRAAEAAAATAAAERNQYTLDQAKELVRNWSSVSAPDARVVRTVAAALQQQQQRGGTSPGSDPPPPPAAASSNMPEDGNPVGDMSFVTLMRWYSFQILMDELLAEMDTLYCSVKEVVQVLPHGL